ncbi:MAG: YebC/PmpR family DNA-binding transcriptional regulator [Clostridia bacterium]|nr:YebC/PmpR family DNA-binding transcriptional regulator [Clostridia bacterium]
MSGHSKWNNINNTKEKMDAQRGKIFTKIGKEIVVAVKAGGSDPNTNSKLRDVIAKAKANNMPNDNIQRSIKKASGELANVNYSSIVYEGYGVGGSAIICECLTDNKNRTAGDVRHIFDKAGGSLGTTNSVSYLFSREGQLVIEKKSNIDEEALMDMVLEAEASDMVIEDDVYVIKTEPNDLHKVKAFLEERGLEFLEAEIALVPQTYVDLTDEQYEKFEKMLDALESNDDVQEVYHNVQLKD